MITPARPVGTGDSTDTSGNVTPVLGVLFRGSVAITYVLSVPGFVPSSASPSSRRGPRLRHGPRGRR